MAAVYIGLKSLKDSHLSRIPKFVQLSAARGDFRIPPYHTPVIYLGQHRYFAA